MIQELRTGGAERIAVTLCRAAHERGDTVAVAAAPGELELELADVLSVPRFPLPVLARRPQRLPAATRRLRRAIREFRPDVIHAHNPSMALLTSLAGGRRKTSLVSVHGVPEPDWPATGRVLRLSRLPVVACGPGVAAALTDERCEPVATITNGVGPAPAPVSRSDLDALFGLPPDCVVVLVVGRLADQKNQQLAIRAMPRLPSDVRLLLVGDGVTKPALEALARDVGVANRVVFAGRRAGRPLMAAADINCICSRWEGLPLVALEAMASGKPLVATSVRGTRELVVDRETGLLVPPDDPASLAAAIDRIVAEPQLAASLAAAAQAAAASMTESAMVDAYFRLYDRLAA